MQESFVNLTCINWRLDYLFRTQKLVPTMLGLNRFHCTYINSTNKTDHHDITEILLKVAFNTINPNPANPIIKKLGIISKLLIYLHNPSDIISKLLLNYLHNPSGIISKLLLIYLHNHSGIISKLLLIYLHNPSGIISKLLFTCTILQVSSLSYY